jgi:hypothetical protein
MVSPDYQSLSEKMITMKCLQTFNDGKKLFLGHCIVVELSPQELVAEEEGYACHFDEW